MANLIRNFIFAGLLLLNLSCEKDKISLDKDLFIEEPEQLSELHAEALAVGRQFIEVQWNNIYSTHFKTVTYSIYLDGKKIGERLNTNKYSFINLRPGHEYTIKVEASTEQGKHAEQELKLSTLSETGSEAGSSLYKEYKIHSYSDITGPTAVKQLEDGGHLIVRYLEHQSTFGSPDVKKIIVLRVDKEGNLQWYRLLATLGRGLSDMPAIFLELHNDGREGIALTGSYAFKISVADGELVLEKDFQEPAVRLTQSMFYSSEQQLLIGTGKGGLISVNPDDLSVQWQQEDTSRPGQFTAINTDSRGNIYSVFIDARDDSHVHVLKYTGEGQYLADFSFEVSSFFVSSILVDEQDNFYMFPYLSTWNSIYYIKFKGDGTSVKNEKINGSFSSPKAFWNNKNEIVVYGRYDGNGLTTYGGIYVFDTDMNVKSRHFYDSIPFHLLGAVTQDRNGSYNLFLHYMQTYSYDNRNFVYIKTNPDGEI